MEGGRPEGHVADPRNTRMDETSRRQRIMEVSSEGGQGPVGAVRRRWKEGNGMLNGTVRPYMTGPVEGSSVETQAIYIYIYIGFKTLFYVVRRLDSVASYLPTGLHLGFFRSWPSLVAVCTRRY